MKTMLSQYDIGRLRGSCADYNSNNSWYFNGTNGCVNNNNRYNGNFRCRPSLDSDRYDDEQLEVYPIPLSFIFVMSLQSEKGKRGKPCYVFHILHRVSTLTRLTHEMNNSEVLPTESTAHIIFEPRVREIVCAEPSKRVMQTFYISQLQPILERYVYHPDSFSCRPGKGGLKAVQQLQEYVYEASDGYTTDCWLAKVDLQAFFMSLDCFKLTEIVEGIIRQYMADSPYYHTMLYLTRIVYLAATKDHLKDMARPEERALLEPRKSLYNCEYYRGVPIGDWTSQTAGLIITTYALRYLESLGYRFVHYTDDTCIVVCNKRQWLDEDLPRLELFYREQLGLTLHPKKRYLQHYSKGVELLGFKVRFNRILPSDRIYHNMSWYIERTVSHSERDFGWLLRNKNKVLSSVNSYLGMLRHMSGYNMRKRICEQVTTSQMGRVFECATDYTKIGIRPHYSDAAYYRREYRKLKSNIKFSFQ